MADVEEIILTETEIRDANIMSELLLVHQTLVSLCINPDGFGSKSIAGMSNFALQRIDSVMSRLGYSEEDVLDLEARLTEGIPGGHQPRWEPYVDDDCPGKTAIRSR